MTKETGTRLCLASPIFYPTYGGSTLRFLRYLPGFSQRGIDCRVLTGTPLAEDAVAADNRALCRYVALYDELAANSRA